MADHDDPKRIGPPLPDARVPDPVCYRCRRRPGDIPEYVDAAAENDTTPDAFVRAEEGTYNAANGHFCCTDCYAAIGMPTAPNGWKAP